ncbi:hypothetical protein DFH08DRAFT_836155 [Mycena albidolilacea]|uniref:Uncharacterized protein n=1 Tax=Mycena albidolilacea TaxID=1033008 RepID=A0AAD7ASA1_9AGAR|nr:hypothetical protein DFH08DRAFT_836155 [Mycena albidolilacea]
MAYSKVVMIDCPDPDNVLMALWVLKQFPDSPVAIVLSARPVSFKAALYRNAFQRLLNAVGDIRKLINPLTENSLRDAEKTWLKDLPQKDRAWFRVSDDFSDPTVREDTRLYMQVTAFRMVNFWKAHGIGPTRYRIYWDKASMTNAKIGVGMAHSFHVHDWSFDFNGDERQRYDQALRSISDAEGNVIVPLSDGYRVQNRAICIDYVARMAQASGWTAENILGDFDHFIVENKTAGVVADLYVGGPFPDALAYVQRAPVTEVVGMGGNLKSGSTLFANQFNFHVALESATEFLTYVVDHKIKLTLLPTECVKGSVFALSREELFTVFEASEAAVRVCLQYYDSANGHGQSFPLFDLIAVLTVQHRDLYPRKAVRVRRVDEKTPDANRQDVIEWVEDPKGHIQMYWPDQDHMKLKKAELLDAIRATVE